MCLCWTWPVRCHMPKDQGAYEIASDLPTGLRYGGFYLRYGGLYEWYIYIYICVCVCKCKCIYIYIYKYIIYVCVCACVCICIWCSHSFTRLQLGQEHATSASHADCLYVTLAYNYAAYVGVHIVTLCIYIYIHRWYIYNKYTIYMITQALYVFIDQWTSRKGRPSHVL